MNKFDPFLVFILAHLTGDFVLQSNKIARMKSSGMKGLLIHSGIIGGVQILFLSIYGLHGMLAAVIGGLVHFIIDYAKNYVGRYFRRQTTIYFVLDQIVHFTVIWMLTILLLPGNRDLGIYIEYIKLVIGIITICYVSTVAAKMLLADLRLQSGKGEFFKPGERIADAITALTLWAGSLKLGMYNFVLVGVFFLIYYLYHKSRFKYTLQAILVKYLLFIAFAYLISVLLR